jgi:hypothetical protein
MPGAVVQCADQLGLRVPPPFGAGDVVPHACAVVHEHVLLDRAGVRVVGEIRLLRDDLDEAG